MIKAKLIYLYFVLLISIFLLSFKQNSYDNVKSFSVVLAGKNYDIMKKVDLISNKNERYVFYPIYNNFEYSGYMIYKNNEMISFSITKYNPIESGNIFFSEPNNFYSSFEKFRISSESKKVKKLVKPNNLQHISLIKINKVNYIYNVHYGVQHGFIDVYPKYYQDVYDEMTGNGPYYCGPTAGAKLISFYDNFSDYDVYDGVLPLEHKENYTLVNDYITIMGKWMLTSKEHGTWESLIDNGIGTPFIKYSNIYNYQFGNFSSIPYFIENKTPIVAFLKNQDKNLGHFVLCTAYQIDERGNGFLGYYDNYMIDRFEYVSEKYFSSGSYVAYSM